MSLLPAVDRAAFCVAFADRLRRHGVAVELTATQDFVRALVAVAPMSRTQLYWAARITLVRRRPDLARFDEVFEAVFGEALLSVDPHARRDGARSGPRGVDARPPAPGEPYDVSGASGDRSGLPWATLPPVDADAGHDDDVALSVPQRLPSELADCLDVPFEQLDAVQAQLLGQWLERGLREWPVRRSRRYAVRPGGPRVAIRETAARARRTGWDPVHLVRTGPVRRPRRVVVLCDVSRSMQAQARAYLHLMRALTLTTHAEVFAFATSLTRLTTTLGNRSTEAALEEATERVADRFGGTRIAHCLSALLASHHGGTVRGAVVLIGSDGWDGDPPERLAAAMARLRRRAHLVVWLNPRAAAPGFAPRTTTMAAALPHVDLLLPADTFADLLRVPGEIARHSRRD
ncbi:VWA domain-containing protein [Streptomyces sp. NPDC101225]|uniref:vWA domain-containing protein n=1 Tax=Streptomyces sp. NPDC101225 TaxID=3366135 RepID=UPI00380BB30E